MADHAWKRVAREVAEGTLGGEFDRNDRAELQSKVKDAEEAAKDEIWGDYRFAILANGQETDGLKVIDLGAGHSSSGGTLCGRVIAALKSEALLNESVGASYIERNWPPALRDTGAWPLATLRQSFLNGSLTRLVDPDAVLRRKIVEFVAGGDFGLASGGTADGSYERVWFQEAAAPDEVAFEAGVFLLRQATAEALRSGARHSPCRYPNLRLGPSLFLRRRPDPSLCRAPRQEPFVSWATFPRRFGTASERRSSRSFDPVRISRSAWTSQLRSTPQALATWRRSYGRFYKNSDWPTP